MLLKGGKIMSTTTVLKKSEIEYEDMTGKYRGTSIARFITPELSDTLGAGIVIFEKCSYDWTVTYNEVLYILEGHLRVVVGDQNFDCDTGDAIWLPINTPLRYETEGKAVCFYAIYPGDGMRWDLVGLPPLPPRAASR